MISAKFIPVWLVTCGLLNSGIKVSRKNLIRGRFSSLNKQLKIDKWNCKLKHYTRCICVSRIRGEK